MRDPGSKGYRVARPSPTAAEGETVNPIEILHLEDCPLDAELIQARLVKGGFEPSIVRVTERDEFVAALAGQPHDLILADYSLPSFDGLSALDIARERATELPFLFVTGVLGEEVAIETLKRGATDYILKQRLERLVPAVRRALAEARERSERRRAEAAVRAGELRMRLTVDSITDYAVVSADTQGV
jgi:DNA-binding response OmpR family regulator